MLTAWTRMTLPVATTRRASRCAPTTTSTTTTSPTTTASAATLTTAAFILLWRNAADPVTRRELNFQFNDLVPHRIAALTFGNGKQFTQAPSQV
jgi:hypothetical protein